LLVDDLLYIQDVVYTSDMRRFKANTNESLLQGWQIDPCAGRQLGQTQCRP